jgi:DmsE family decaheme c-type cytochrome
MATKNGFRPTMIFAVLCCVLAFAAVPLTVAQETASVPDEDCLGCHEDVDATLARSPHRLASELNNPKAEITCVSCHSGAATHVEDPSAENIGNPAKQSAQAVSMTCQTCHVAHLELDNIGFDPHLDLGVNCTDCHSVHSDHPGLLVDEQLDFCGECHIALASEFGRRSTHPVNEGQITCLSCHSFTADLQPNFGAGTAENCVSCHPLVGGPFPYQHDAASSYYPGGEGCTSCHNPHGSPNDRLLTQTGDGLCAQCHGVPPLHQTFHGGVGTQFDCIECHVDVHGSDHNRGLLDADLGTKIGGQPATCFCHGTN